MNDDKDKIKCTIGILTLNSETGLAACLRSVKDFTEIIVCDGNSTDKTRGIAKSFGAKIINQYESKESNITCVKDKAYVRQKNMEASTSDWYFYMDADDTLSPEVIEEIRSITSNPDPKYLIYKMPTRIFFETEDGLREIKHEATYPSYQTRLVHKSVGARFRGEIHDRLAFDAQKFSVGTMKGYYNFHWPDKRVNNFWAYLGRYADWELEVPQQISFGNLLYWGIYRRKRTILGYLFYRLPFMYARYGFRDSMPIGIEFTIVRYHTKILLGTIARYMKNKSPWIYIREIFRGKDTNRILTNMALMNKECYGSILDIGGGKGRASHYRFINMMKWHKITSVDISAAAKPDYVLDIEKDKLPFGDDSYDYVYLFNVLEHIDRRSDVLGEIHRVLKSVRIDGGLEGRRESGQLVGAIPFLVNVHPDPHDFIRLTGEGLKNIFTGVGFSEIEIKPVGFGPFTAGYCQFEYLVPRILRVIFGPITMLLDLIVSVFSKNNLSERFPLSYIFYAKK